MPSENNGKKESPDVFVVVIGLVFIFISLFAVFNYGPGSLLGVTAGGSRTGGIPMFLFLILGLVGVASQLKYIMQKAKRKNDH